jgi:hypothetical protein
MNFAEANSMPLMVGAMIRCDHATLAAQALPGVRGVLRA